MKTALVCVAGAFYAFGALMMMFAVFEPAIAPLSVDLFGFAGAFLAVAWLVRGDWLPCLGTAAIAIWIVCGGATALAITLAVCALAHAAEFGARRRIALAATTIGVGQIAAVALARHVVAFTAAAFATHAVLGVIVMFTSSTWTGSAQVRRALRSRGDSTR